MQRIETVVAAAPPLSGAVLDGLLQPQASAAALAATPLLPDAVSAEGAPTSIPQASPQALTRTADPPDLSGLHQTLGAALFPDPSLHAPGSAFALPYNQAYSVRSIADTSHCAGHFLDALHLQCSMLPLFLKAMAIADLRSDTGECVGGAGAPTAAARFGTAAQAMGPVAPQGDVQRLWQEAVDGLQVLIDAAPVALAAAYNGPEGRRRLAGMEAGMPHMHFGIHKVLLILAPLQCFFSAIHNKSSAPSCSNTPGLPLGFNFFVC